MRSFSKDLFILLMGGFVCMVLTQCGIFRDKYAGNTKEAKRYKSLLVCPAEEQMRNADVWVSDDMRHVNIYFDGEGLPVTFIDSSFKEVNEENVTLIVTSFLKQNTHAFGALHDQLRYKSMRLDSISGRQKELLTYYFDQIYKSVPVFSRAMSNSKASAEFSNNALLAIRMDVEQNLSADPNPTITQEQALDSLHKWASQNAADTSNHFVYTENPLSPSGPCKTMLVFTRDISPDSELHLAWLFVFGGLGTSIFGVDAHNGSLVLLGGSTGDCENVLEQ